MEKYQNDEMVLDLVDICFFLLKKWRSLLALILLGLLLGAGFGYGKSESIPAEIVQTPNLEQAYNSRILYDRMVDYQKESPVIHMDPDSVYCGTLICQIQSENDREALLVRYVKLLDDALTEKLIAASGMTFEKAYIGELVSCGIYAYHDGNSVAENLFGSEETVVMNETKLYTENCVAYMVKAPSEAACTAMIEVFRQAADGLGRELEKEGYEFTASELSGNVVKQNPHNQIALMEDKMAHLSTARTNMQNAEKALSEEEKQVLSVLLGEEMAHVDEKADIIKSTAKWAAVGMLLSIVLWGGWHLISYLMNGQIKTASELQDSWALPHLGKLAITENTARGIDRRLFMMQEKCGETPVEAAFLEKLIANMTDKKVALCGDASQDAVKTAMAQLTEKNSQIVAVSFPSTGADALRQLKEVNQAIVLVCPGVTARKQIVRELQLCALQEIQILGTITVQ